MASNTTRPCDKYDVKPGDTCSSIGDKLGLDTNQLELMNAQTWQWRGCSRLQAGATICTTAGYPGLPAAINGTLCGPQVPGTKVTELTNNLSDLNPCPLNACCSVHGYCGITAEFCTVNEEPSRCISNCGHEILSSAKGSDDFITVAYFQASNTARPCLNMDVSEIDGSRYSHIHFAFANIRAGTFGIDISHFSDQFEAFVKMRSFKRIITVGGWAFSTSPQTFGIFRDMVKPENRVIAATSIANFVIEHDLDGIDLDWEYPGASDIPNIPQGRPSEGKDFADFLRILRSKLPGKSISIALPSSYWYLKNLPIDEMMEYLDYAVYMTYDYHGLWDYGNKHSQAGCDGGNCLRSHINMTETIDSLSMITKAGAPSNKIVVGVSSYARGYRMVSSNCTHADCTWTKEGDQPTGHCTREPGVLADGEAQAMLKADDGGIISLKDEESDSDIIIFNHGLYWLAFMSEDTKQRRIEKYRAWKFAGVADWSVDLQHR